MKYVSQSRVVRVQPRVCPSERFCHQIVSFLLRSVNKAVLFNISLYISIYFSSLYSTETPLHIFIRFFMSAGAVYFVLITKNCSAKTIINNNDNN